jgi:hypothetical protein
MRNATNENVLPQGFFCFSLSSVTPSEKIQLHSGNHTEQATRKEAEGSPIKHSHFQTLFFYFFFTLAGIVQII